MDVVVDNFLRNAQFSQQIARKLLICISLVLFVKFALFYWKRRHLYIAARKFPGPPSWPIGIAWAMIGKDTGEIMDFLVNLIDTYKPVCAAWTGPIFTVAIRRPEDVKIVLTSPHAMNKSLLYRAAEPLLGKGLITAEAKIWKRHRKIIQPTFNQKILNSFVSIINMHVDILVDERLSLQTGKRPFDIFDFVSRFTLDSTCESVMGTKINSQCGDSQYTDAFNKVVENAYLRVAKIWIFPDFIFWRTSYGIIFKKCLKIMNDLSIKIIREKRSRLVSNGSSHNHQDSYLPKQRQIFLDYMLTSSDESGCLTDQEILDEVNTLIAAGNDTSANVLSFTTVMLGMFPEIQEQVHRELIDIFGDEKRSVTSEDLTQMKYLEMVIKESMRLFPVVPMILRSTTEKINLGDYTIPKDATVLCSIMNIHRDPEIYPEPLKFDPDRFLPEEVAKRHPYAFIPFSAGPRICLGIHYAMMTMKIALTKIVLKYKISTPFKTVEDFKLKGNIVLRSADGCLVSIENRA